MASEWLTVKEACEYLKVSKSTLYLWCDKGILRYYEFKDVGRGRRFKKEDLDALLELGGTGIADESKK